MKDKLRISIAVSFSLKMFDFNLIIFIIYLLRKNKNLVFEVSVKGKLLNFLL